LMFGSVYNSRLAAASSTKSFSRHGVYPPSPLWGPPGYHALALPVNTLEMAGESIGNPPWRSSGQTAKRVG
jgi:hypothetical protein